MRQQVKRRRRHLKPRVKSALISILIGSLIGGQAGYGHIKSAEAYEKEKLAYLKSIPVVDYDQLREEWNEEHPEAEEISYTVTEMTEEDLEEENYYDSLEMLAQLVEAEAGNQDIIGKRLVVDVVLNRVASDQFPDTIEEVILQENQFSSMWDGGFDRAGWRMQDEDYKAVLLELDRRTDSRVLYFTAGGYGNYGTPAYQEGDHYFCYE